MTVSAVPATLPDYDRNDWKQWTDADRDCQDARNEVLIAESRTAVAYRTDRKCRVAAGEWLAPYTNTIVTDPGRLDVDHMVPLGNAHDSGAWQWSANQRERYANYLEDPQHLIAVTAGANRSKGARGPDQWKPEDRTYWCQYAVDWISIKSTWELTVTQQEHTSLVQMLNTCAKRPELMVSSQSQVKPTPGPTSNPVQQTPTPKMRTYNSCDAAQAAGETRVQGSKGNGRGFPEWMVPSARDGDGDGVVCEKGRGPTGPRRESPPSSENDAPFQALFLPHVLLVVPGLDPNPPKRWAVALTPGMMGKGRRTGQARFQ